MPTITQIDDQIIPELPFTWRMALTQGNTNVVATPSSSQLQNIEQLAKDLIPIIELIGPCSVNSWLRTPEHNIAVGGLLILLIFWVLLLICTHLLKL